MASGAATGGDEQVTSPREMQPGDWKAIVVRAVKEASADSIGLIAAGVSFYTFLAIVPLLGATALTYGLVADIQTVNHHVARIVSLLPGDAGKLIADQLVAVVESSSGKKGLGLAIAIGIAPFGARNAAAGAIQALNIAYEEKERRSFIMVTLLALSMTAAAVLAAVFVMLGIGSIGFLHVALPTISPAAQILSRVVSYVVLALVGATAAALLYRYGPSRKEPRWRWLTPGSTLFAVAWVLLTLGFGFYVRRLGSYGATYGSLSAIVVLLTWLYLSAYALLFGAELNYEAEQHTAHEAASGLVRT